MTGRIFGFTPSPLSAREIAATVLTAPDAPRLVVTANIDHIARLRRDAAFAAAYDAAAIVTCDGFPVACFARLRGCAVPGRVTGCDIAAALLRAPHLDRVQALFFAVDSAATAARLTDWAAARGLAARTAIAVVPRQFQQREDAQRALARRIRDHGTTLLLMGIGAPRSEIFIHAHRHALPPCWALCVGQALRVEMGLIPRAPAAWQFLNLEWLWRLLLEPRRLAGRYAGAALGFLRAVAAECAPRWRLRTSLAAALASLLGCAAPAPPGPMAAMPPYRLHAGDELEIRFTGTPELNQRQTIRNDGSLPLPMAGDVPAAGLTVPQLHDALLRRYASTLVHPDITVILRTATANRVFVGGEVVMPGAQSLDSPLTAARAIILAQGLKPTANAHQVLVIHTAEDGTTAARVVDIHGVLAGESQAADVPLQPFDMVFVPDTTIARMDRFVEQYIRQLLPTTPSVIYEINPTTTVRP